MTEIRDITAYTPEDSKPPRAFFFDIDGTLVPYGSHRVPDEVADALRKLREAGYLVFIATGRHPEWIDALPGLEFDGYVCVNGGLCLAGNGKDVYYMNKVADEDMKRFIEFAPQSSLSYAVIPADGGIFVTKRDDAYLAVEHALHIPFTPEKPISEAENKDIVQLMVFGPEKEELESGIYENVLTNCLPTRWAQGFSDIVPAGNNKGIGISMMAKHFNIPIEQCVAFGDGNNDIEMLQTAGIGIAMDNASDMVKGAADYVTDSCENHGVVSALKAILPNLFSF